MRRRRWLPEAGETGQLKAARGARATYARKEGSDECGKARQWRVRRVKLRDDKLGTGIPLGNVGHEGVVARVSADSAQIDRG